MRKKVNINSENVCTKKIKDIPTNNCQIKLKYW